MNEIITINNTNIAVKEYGGKRVVTFKDIDTVHSRTEGTARKRFNDNKKHFVEGEDFYKISPSEFRTAIGDMDKRQQNDVTLITESGYLMLVKSFTDDLAWEVQRQLVNNYFRMYNHIQMQAAEIQRMEAEARKNRAIAMRINAENRRMKMLLDHPNMDKLSPIALETLGLKRMEEITGIDVGNVLPQTEQTYSATEVGKMLGGITANKIGSTAKKNGIKIDTYGTWVNDKSRYSDKQVPSFRYNMTGVRKLGEILGVEVIP